MCGEVLARSLQGNANFRFMVELPLTGIAPVAVTAEKTEAKTGANDTQWILERLPAAATPLRLPSDERRSAALRGR